MASTWPTRNRCATASCKGHRSPSRRSATYSIIARTTLERWCDCCRVCSRQSGPGRMLCIRGRVQWAIAKIEHRGLPFDLPLLTRLRRHWDGMRIDMVSMLDPFGVYEIVDGVAHWRMDRFEAFVAHYKLAWPRLASGKLCTDDETFREMAILYPMVNPLRELRCSLSKLKLNALAVGARCTQSHAVVGLLAPRPHAVRQSLRSTSSARPSGCVSRCATAGACADPSRLSAAGSSHCGGRERRRQRCWRHVRAATFIWASPSRSGCCATA